MYLLSHTHFPFFMLIFQIPPFLYSLCFLLLWVKIYFVPVSHRFISQPLKLRPVLKRGNMKQCIFSLFSLNLQENYSSSYSPSAMANLTGELSPSCQPGCCFNVKPCHSDRGGKITTSTREKNLMSALKIAQSFFVLSLCHIIIYC